MHTQKLLNPVTGDIWFCDDITRTKEIEGVHYVSVYKQNPNQTHLMRKDALKRVDSTHKPGR